MHQCASLIFILDKRLCKNELLFENKACNPILSRYAAPTRFTIVKASAEVAGMTDSPAAAIITCRKAPVQVQ